MLLQTAALLGVLLLGFGYFWLLVPNTEARLQQLGLFCSVFTISMYLSPLADLVSEVSREVAGEIRVRLGRGGEWGAGGKGWVTRPGSMFDFGRNLDNVEALLCLGSNCLILSHRPKSFRLNQPNVSPSHSP